MSSLFLIAVCLINVETGDMNCIPTQFESRSYIDCVDNPDAPPIHGTEGGSGFFSWGSVFGDEFTVNGSTEYTWRGVQDRGGGFGYLLLGVDPDKMFSDGGERECRSGFLG